MTTHIVQACEPQYDHALGLSDLELIALSLHGVGSRVPSLGNKRRHLQRAAKQLEDAGSLRALLRSAPPSLQAARELIRRAMAEDLKHANAFRSPRELDHFLRIWLSDRNVECFAVLFLNAQFQLIQAETLFQGTVNQTAKLHGAPLSSMPLLSSWPITTHREHSKQVKPTARSPKRFVERSKQLISVCLTI